MIGRNNVEQYLWVVLLVVWVGWIAFRGGGGG